jgi:ferritin-like metal-binding protein YciE
MEVKAEAMLGTQVSRLDDYPRIQRRVEQQLEETRGQQALLESCLRRLASGPSLLKGMAREKVAFGQVVAGMTVPDEVVEGVMNAYVFEHTEIAAYRALIPAAYAAGDRETGGVCEQILWQEVEMAHWLLEHMLRRLPNTLCAAPLTATMRSGNQETSRWPIPWLSYR